MSDWQVLGLAGDPTPGDPAGTRDLASRLQQQAELAGANAGRLRTLAAGDGDLAMQGDYAPKYSAVLAELPGQLTTQQTAYTGCGTALAAFAATLTQAKTTSATALRDGEDADARYTAAMNSIRALLPGDRQVMLGTGLGLNPIALDAAMIGLDESTKTAITNAASRARTAQADRDAARHLADQAAQLRADGETRAVTAIDAALDPIKNKPWWEKAWDFVSAPFRSWDTFVDLCKKVALVAGIVALFISGPIGWALVAGALVAGAVGFANTLAKYARGQATLGDVLLDSLYLLPGEAGVIKLSGLGRALVTMVRSLLERDGLEAAAKLIQELARSGVAHTPENIVAIARGPDGKIIFMETGNARAGLAHIVAQHGAQFAQHGIPENEIPQFVLKAATDGVIVGYQRTRPIYEFLYRRTTYRLAVDVGDNGFIVGANFRSMGR